MLTLILTVFLIQECRQFVNFFQRINVIYKFFQSKCSLTIPLDYSHFQFTDFIFKMAGISLIYASLSSKFDFNIPLTLSLQVSITNVRVCFYEQYLCIVITITNPVLKPFLSFTTTFQNYFSFVWDICNFPLNLYRNLAQNKLQQQTT